MGNEKQLLISRIISSKIPAYDYEAELEYEKTLTHAIFGGCLTNQELLDKLAPPIDFVSEIKKTNVQLSHKKQKLYEWRDTPSSKEYRADIASLKQAISFLLNQQYNFFISSAEYIATQAKNRFICEKYNIDEIPERLEESEIRLVARSYEWFSLYNAGFRCEVFSQEVIDLINWAKKYENIRQHPDAPTEDVIEDDDLLDGWMSYISNKKDHDTATDGKEVFIPANSPEDIRRIQDKNSPEVKFMMKMRDNKMMKNGELNENDLPDKQGIIKF